ncbi:MAG: dodecin family protein [Gammaproteobacteria bacterium]|nr:dodecin family protein [Gammaproteobacteria bacterium]
MSVARVTEMISQSSQSFDDALQDGITRANKTLRNVKSVWIKEQSVELNKNGEIDSYRVALKVTFVVED